MTVVAPPILWRLIASFIDLAVIFGLAIIFALPFGGQIQIGAQYVIGLGVVFVYKNGFFFFISLLVYPLLVGIFAKNTLGKHLMEIHVIQKTHHDILRPTRRQWVIRAVVKPLEFLFGFPLMLVTETQSSIGDWLSGTRNIRKIPKIEDLSPVDEIPKRRLPIGKYLRYALAVIVLLISLSSLFTSINYLPTIMISQVAGHNTWREMADALITGSYEAIYEDSGEDLKQSVDLREFTRRMNNVAFVLRRDGYSIEQIRFDPYQWIFYDEPVDYMEIHGVLSPTPYVVKLTFKMTTGKWILAGIAL